jgi:hypothetical protein
MKRYHVESVGNKQCGWTPWNTPCYITDCGNYQSLTQAKASASKRVNHNGARVSVVVDTECNEDYGVVVYLIEHMPVTGPVGIDVNIPYPEWHKAADVAPKESAEEEQL